MRRLRIFTRRGTCVVVGALALIAIGMVSGFSDLIRAGVFAAALVLGALVLISFRGISAEVGRAHETQARLRVSQREAITIEMKVRRGTRLPVRLRVEHQFSGDSTPKWHYPRLAPGTTTLRYHVTPAHRGRFISGPLEAQFTDPLGLTQRSLVCGTMHRWLVWPQLVTLAASPSLTSGRGDEELSSTHHPISGHVGVLVRAYAAGDDIRHVHWSATARRGELMVRQFEPPASDLMRIVLNGDVAVAGSDPEWETLISLAASTLVHFTRGGIPAELVLGEQTFRSAQEALDALAILGSCPTPLPSPRETATLLLQHPSSTPTLEAPRTARGVAFLHGSSSPRHVEALNRLGWEVYEVSSRDQDPLDSFRELLFDFGTSR